MNKIFLLILLLSCNGCVVWLRYHYEEALSNLPPNTRVINLNNSYILYSKIETNDSVIQTNIYKAYYDGEYGKIYKTRKAN